MYEASTSAEATANETDVLRLPSRDKTDEAIAKAIAAAAKYMNVSHPIIFEVL
jgi:hypothetical protein